ncbi:MAG: hypothetical protein ACXVAN_09055, partial [Polyangia bacterium]
MEVGGPPLFAEWLLAHGTDDLATVRQDCPRADWLLWLSAAAGLSTEQLAHGAAAAMRSVLTLAPGCEWPLATMLRSVEGGTVDPALLPTSEEMALTIARLSGAAQRIALAVRSLYKVAGTHRVLSLQMVTAVVRAAALAPLEARHPELATLSSRELSQLLDRAFRSSSELELVGGRGPE